MITQNHKSVINWYKIAPDLPFSYAMKFKSSFYEAYDSVIDVASWGTTQKFYGFNAEPMPSRFVRSHRGINL